MYVGIPTCRVVYLSRQHEYERGTSEASRPPSWYWYTALVHHTHLLMGSDHQVSPRLPPTVYKLLNGSTVYKLQLKTWRIAFLATLANECKTPTGLECPSTLRHVYQFLSLIHI